VLGRPSPRWGQEIVAVLALHRHDDPVTDSELRDQAARQLARYKLPKVIVRVEQVRRHPNGKPDYRWAKRLVDTAGGPA
jgi:acyl-CoA synthetase (AMP-forming)/AMP-acid ligase II